MLLSFVWDGEGILGLPYHYNRSNTVCSKCLLLSVSYDSKIYSVEHKAITMRDKHLSLVEGAHCVHGEAKTVIPIHLLGSVYQDLGPMTKGCGLGSDCDQYDTFIHL